MDNAEFEQAIAGLQLNRRAFFTTIGSTNDLVAEWAREGTQGPAIVAADEQTRGRGRAGRRWATPSGSALAFSLLLDTADKIEPSVLAKTAGLGAVVVCEALEVLYGLHPTIKWPNDVLLNGKKVCGVLPEAHWTGERLQALILGVGINVAAKSVPPVETLTFPAVSVEEITGHKVNPSELLRTVLERIFAWKERLGEPDFITAWDQRLAYMGERITFATNGNAVEAKLLGLSGDGSLRLQLKSGEERAFQMGEIQIRPAEIQ